MPYKPIQDLSGIYLPLHRWLGPNGAIACEQGLSICLIDAQLIYGRASSVAQKWN